ncbi:MAG: hypothetical protein HUU21_26600 [Polyangiaceae bacterium]|nr:hypothetical protein [Polyangiaceae bacterium]NUQ77121.1 hypothetical protein [Polyangiaceae bacterium]
MPNVPRRAVPVALAALLALSAAPARAEPPGDESAFSVDEGLHFGVAMAVTMGGYGLCALVAPDMVSRSITGAGFGMGGVFFKEAADYAGFGPPSGKDVLVGLSGVAIGLGLSLTIDIIIEVVQDPPKTP